MVQSALAHRRKIQHRPVARCMGLSGIRTLPCFASLSAEWGASSLVRIAYATDRAKVNDSPFVVEFSTRASDNHFHWMALHGVDGAFLHRCADRYRWSRRRLRNEIGDRVRLAAGLEGRVFAIIQARNISPMDNWLTCVSPMTGIMSVALLHIASKRVFNMIGSGVKRTLDSPDYLKRRETQSSESKVPSLALFCSKSHYMTCRIWTRVFEPLACRRRCSRRIPSPEYTRWSPPHCWGALLRVTPIAIPRFSIFG